MLHRVNDFRHHIIQATDGEIGFVSDALIDDEFWILRYLVVDTGHWLSERKVLLIPGVLGKPDWQQHHLPVKLTRAQVEQSPDIDSDKPVSRQYELKLNAYYGWPFYWAGTEPLPTGLQPAVPVPPARVEPTVPTPKAEGDPHLRSVRELHGYHIHAEDGEIGHVEDFLVDDETWDVRYMVVATRNWLPGRKVLVAPQWLVGQISWSRRVVNVIMTRDSIRHSPEYDPASLPDRAYEDELHRHYRRPGYWESDSKSRKAA